MRTPGPGGVGVGGGGGAGVGGGVAVARRGGIEVAVGLEGRGSGALDEVTVVTTVLAAGSPSWRSASTTATIATTIEIAA